MALTAAPETQARLLDLQQLDTALQQLAHRARTHPERAAVTALQEDAERIKAAVVETSGHLEDARLELARIESDVELVEKRIARDSERMQQSSSVKDIQGLEHELGSLKARLSELEEIELTLMERIELLENAANGARETLEAHTARRTVAEEQLRAALAELDAERGRVQSERDALAAELPADLVALYEKQRERYGTGASHLRARVSSASGVTLTGSDLDMVRRAAPDEVILCPDSNAILVRTAESGL
jgi:predicted  nucleic acid-binding Zn-ribbon protein